MALSLIPPIWKEAPFLRLLVPFAAGIFLQQNVDIHQDFVLIFWLLAAFLFALLQLNNLYFKFKYSWLTGLVINLLLAGIGYLTCAYADGMRKKNSIVNLYSPGSSVQVTLEEPLIEKTNSYKATASIDYLATKNTLINAKGKINIYFAREVDNETLNYGSTLVISKHLEPIRNSGNPGEFDYRLYCERQGIYYSVFLAPSEYRLLDDVKENEFKKFIFVKRKEVVDVLSRYISGAKESGLAKALLIGYKDDLDKNLVQAYSNTGVVHIIAISGLHLGIIYWLLSVLLKPLQRIARWKWLSVLLILVGLWSFSFLAGAGPSVLRSAFMFSMIAVGNSISRNSNVLNNLFLSAFILLCYNPYWLWDAGFQLSYAAVLSIVIFFKPIHNWFYFPNKIVGFIWQIISVTIAAQILTLPISIYHFHQFPIYFILSNLVAVPLSSVILIGEILICCVAFIPSIASVVGTLTTWLIQLLNTYIENVNQLPFAVWGQLRISLLQTFVLFVIIAGIATWMMLKYKRAFWCSMVAILLFGVLRLINFFETKGQLKFIVYNLQRGRAIDFINANKVTCVCDTSILNDAFVQQMNLSPSRILHQVRETPSLNGFLRKGPLMRFDAKTILLIEDASEVPKDTCQIDVLVISRNPKIDLPSLIGKFSPTQVVVDASNKRYKAATWKKETETLGIAFYNIKSSGAFIHDLR